MSDNIITLLTSLGLVLISVSAIEPSLSSTYSCFGRIATNDCDTRPTSSKRDSRILGSQTHVSQKIVYQCFKL